MAICRGCGAAIAFTTTVNGKLMPIDVDFSPHFATCPQAKRNREPAPPQDECLICGSHDLERLPGQGPHYGAIHCRTCGRHRWLRKSQETTA